MSVYTTFYLGDVGKLTDGRIEGRNEAYNMCVCFSGHD